MLAPDSSPAEEPPQTSQDMLDMIQRRSLALAGMCKCNLRDSGACHSGYFVVGEGAASTIPRTIVANANNSAH